MRITPKQLANRLKLDIITKELEDKEIEISRFAPISSIEPERHSNYGLIIDASKELTSTDKVNLIIICKEEDLTEDEIAKFEKHNLPILQSRFTKRVALATLESYLIKKEQQPQRLHATMLSIYGEGVLIMGPSGIGKSETALELIGRNHLFVGDDAIDVISFAGQTFGKAPRTSRDFIEVRGVGIINVKGMYGVQSMLKEHQVNLIIELVKLEDVKSSIERIGRDYTYKIIAGVDIPTIQVPVSSGRNVSAIIEAAVIAFKQRSNDNYIAVDDMNNRINQGKE